MEEMRIEYKFIPGYEGKQYVKRSKLNGKIVLILQFRKIGCDTVGCAELVQDRLQVWLFLKLQ